MGKRAAIPAFFAALLLVLPTSAWAQAKPPASAEPGVATSGSGASGDKRAARRRRPSEPPPKVVALEGDEIVGKVPKPQVFYVLGRTASHYKGLDVRRSFVRRIVDTLKRNPL